MMDTRNDTLTPHLILTNLFILSNCIVKWPKPSDIDMTSQ
jgi:hypothetical protein